MWNTTIVNNNRNTAIVNGVVVKTGATRTFHDTTGVHVFFGGSGMDLHAEESSGEFRRHVSASHAVAPDAVFALGDLCSKQLRTPLALNGD